MKKRHQEFAAQNNRWKLPRPLDRYEYLDIRSSKNLCRQAKQIFCQEYCSQIAENKGPGEDSKRVKGKYPVTYTLTPNFSAETLEAKRQCMSEPRSSEYFQPRIAFPVKLHLGDKQQVRHFPDNQKSREYITTKPDFQELLKGLLP